MRPWVEEAQSFEEAMWFARNGAGGQGVVVLSPAFPSYDWFGNFTERGDSFRRRVAEWHENRSPIR